MCINYSRQYKLRSIERKTKYIIMLQEIERQSVYQSQSDLFKQNNFFGIDMGQMKKKR